MKINSISTDDNKYINILTSVNKPPEKLYYIGTLPPKRQPTIAIVGTRKSTAYGKEVAYKFAYDRRLFSAYSIMGL